MIVTSLVLRIVQGYYTHLKGEQSVQLWEALICSARTWDNRGRVISHQDASNGTDILAHAVRTDQNPLPQRDATWEQQTMVVTHPALAAELKFTQIHKSELLSAAKPGFPTIL